MAKPVVSIISPTYNHERFIGNCIESVLEQSYANWELIVVDDGSTDQTAEVVASYSDSRIRYFHQENRGIWRLAQTYNFALGQASGDLIAVLEGDDCWPKNRLETQIPVFEKNDIVLCYGHFLRIDENGELLDSKPSSFSNNSIQQSGIVVLRGLLKGEMAIMPVTALIKRNPLESIGGFQQPPYYPAVEHATWLNLAQKGNFYYIDTLLGYWRRHRGQTTGQFLVELRKGRMKYNNEFFENIDEKIRRRIGLTNRHLQKCFLSNIASAYFSKGRYQLIENDIYGAKQSFLKAFRQGGLTTKVKASLGLVSLTLGIDLESLAAIAHRTRYR